MSPSLRRVEEPDGLVGYRSPALEALGVPHLFTTRHGGSAGTPLAPDSTAAAARLAAAAGAPHAEIALAHQVHGADVHLVDGAQLEPRPVADALVTLRADRLLLIRTADCVPLLLASADGRCVAAVHAGWRGLVAGAIPRALAAMAELGAPAAAAALGPCIGVARYEVGAEVADAFEAAALAPAVRRRGALHADLTAAALLQLARGGLGEADAAGRCTYDDAELYSHRRDVTHGGAAATGRLGALVGCWPG
jgi:YfiH family protein